MKRGQLVRHSSYPGLLRIERLYGAVATCSEIDKGLIDTDIKGKARYPKVICHSKNLNPIF